VLLCASTIASTHYSGLLLTGAVVVVLTLLNAFPAVRDYNPLGLASKNMALVSDSVKPQSLLPALGITLILSVLLLVLAVVLFRKKRI
jgi:ABC-2 type transport system permease protein